MSKTITFFKLGERHTFKPNDLESFYNECADVYGHELASVLYESAKELCISRQPKVSVKTGRKPKTWSAIQWQFHNRDKRSTNWTTKID